MNTAFFIFFANADTYQGSTKRTFFALRYASLVSIPDAYSSPLSNVHLSSFSPNDCFRLFTFRRIEFDWNFLQWFVRRGGFQCSNVFHWRRSSAQTFLYLCCSQWSSTKENRAMEENKSASDELFSIDERRISVYLVNSFWLMIAMCKSKFNFTWPIRRLRWIACHTSPTKLQLLFVRRVVVSGTILHPHLPFCHKVYRLMREKRSWLQKKTTDSQVRYRILI